MNGTYISLGFQRRLEHQNKDKFFCIFLKIVSVVVMNINASVNKVHNEPLNGIWKESGEIVQIIVPAWNPENAGTFAQILDN